MELIETAAPCRSELAREEPMDTALSQTTRVIVDVFREQARSYRGGVLLQATNCSA